MSVYLRIFTTPLPHFNILKELDENLRVSYRHYGLVGSTSVDISLLASQKGHRITFIDHCSGEEIYTHISSSLYLLNSVDGNEAIFIPCIALSCTTPTNWGFPCPLLTFARWYSRVLSTKTLHQNYFAYMVQL